MEEKQQSLTWSYSNPREYLKHLRYGLQDAPPLIITVAITGGAQGREGNPHLPETPEQQARSTYEAWNAGASIVHVHARRPENLSMASHETARYEEINSLIRHRCPDIVINNSMAGDLQDTPDGHCRFERGSLYANPEMSSLDCGPVAYRFKLGERQPPLSGRSSDTIIDDVFVTTYGELEELSDEMARLKVKPEFELFNSGQFSILDEILPRPSVKAPYWIQFVLGAQSGNYPTPMDLLHLVERLPADSLFSVIGIGPYQVPLHAMAIILGGHVRVGMEDNLYFSRGDKASSNAQFVERVVKLSETLGRPVATPEIARRMLGLDEQPSEYQDPGDVALGSSPEESSPSFGRSG
ncbi:MAG: 3-keto-5-aminohexanoate cleavage protein [Actinomycetota bacterium]|nr:3-keto-5-aminohexanoate cleavage protein [Actinomycetota bacterium]